MTKTKSEEAFDKQPTPLNSGELPPDYSDPLQKPAKPDYSHVRVNAASPERPFTYELDLGAVRGQGAQRDDGSESLVNSVLRIANAVESIDAMVILIQSYLKELKEARK